MFLFHLITVGTPSRLHLSNSFALRNYSFRIPNIFEKNFSKMQSEQKYRTLAYAVDMYLLFRLYRIVWKITRRYIHITQRETRILHEVVFQKPLRFFPLYSCVFTIKRYISKFVFDLVLLKVRVQNLHNHFESVWST